MKRGSEQKCIRRQFPLRSFSKKKHRISHNILPKSRIIIVSVNNSAKSMEKKNEKQKKKECFERRKKNFKPEVERRRLLYWIKCRLWIFLRRWHILIRVYESRADIQPLTKCLPSGLELSSMLLVLLCAALVLGSCAEPASQTPSNSSSCSLYCFINPPTVNISSKLEIGITSYRELIAWL